MISNFWFPKTQLLKKEEKNKQKKTQCHAHWIKRTMANSPGERPKNLFVKYVANVVAVAAFRTVYGKHAVFCVHFELI